MARVETAFQSSLEGLSRKDGKLQLARPDEEAPVAVTARYLRPLTGRSEIAFLDEKLRVVATITGIDALSGKERALVEEALRERYYLSTILRVEDIDIRLGTRFWRVETDRGPREFALREPGKNVTWLSGDHLVLRDTAGNRFEIPDLASLDGRSQRKVGRSI